MDFLAVASPMGVRETVLVEASEWVEDNQWVLDLAETNPSIVGLVGNLNPNDPKFKTHLLRFSKNPLFRGIRWRDTLVPLDGDLDPMIAAAKQLAEHDLELDLLVPYTKLPSMNRLAQAVPDLRIVINHAGRPGDPKAVPTKWKESGGPYESSYKVVEEYFSGKGREVAEKYFWKNSLAVYRWIER